MFDTKIAVVVRDDLAVWQKLNVVAFLTSGVVGANPGLIGEPYEDAEGNTYNALMIQPTIVLSADRETLKAIYRRAMERRARMSLYIEDMFATGHDAANRAAVKQLPAGDAGRRRPRASRGEKDGRQDHQGRADAPVTASGRRRSRLTSRRSSPRPARPTWRRGKS